jgi:hypothetical protein
MSRIRYHAAIGRINTIPAKTRGNPSPLRATPYLYFVTPLIGQGAAISCWEHNMAKMRDVLNARLPRTAGMHFLSMAQQA